MKKINKNINTKLLLEILNKYKINPKNLSIYIESLTHSSYKNENNIKIDNQRLEFLGDMAISWVTCNYLYNLPSKLPEGEMSLIKSQVTSGKVFASLAKVLELDKLIMIGNGIVTSGINDKIMEDAFEAFIGAIYKDQGIKKVYYVIDSLIFKKIENKELVIKKPPKSLLQELLMSSKGTGSQSIKYVRKEKNDHTKEVQVIVSGIIYGVGTGANYKEAENNAAKNALEKYSKKN